MTIEMTATIELQGLTKRFGAAAVVDDLTARVVAGSVTAFLGPNGAGKTPTLRMLLSLIAPKTGTATIDGRSYEPSHPKALSLSPSGEDNGSNVGAS